jgi:outer membrane protein assembly factor BamB
MPGFTLQNSPMVAPDGTVYLPRTQNNPQADFLYAFDDTGSVLTQRWAVPTLWTTSTELAVGPDGSVYHLAPGRLLTRLDPATGQIVDQSAVPIPFDGSGLTPRLAADREGRIYLTNGAFTNGRLMAFHPDTTPMWDVPFRNVNIGGPSFGPDGTLVVAGTGSNMRAYRTNPCQADLAAPFGKLNFFDLAAYLALYNASDPAADLAAPFGELNFFDIAAYLAAFNAGCP